MLLAIDVRNTHTVVGLIAGSGDHAKVEQHWRIRTEPEVTADELALTIDGLIGEDSERLTGSVGLSTVPSVLHEVRLMAKRTRYSIEALHDVLPRRIVRRWHPAAVALQKSIGADRDLVQAIGQLERIEARHDLTAFVRGVATGRSMG